MIDGRDLPYLHESKGWYREGEHGREVEVEAIAVQPAEAEDKYRITAIINGEAITHEISQKQYDKFLAVDDYHRMKLFSKVFNEVDMKTRPEMRSNLGAKIFAALAAGTVVVSDLAHGIHHHPCPELYGEHFLSRTPALFQARSGFTEGCSRAELRGSDEPGNSGDTQRILTNMIHKWQTEN